jgi:putative flippase GtrA
MGAVLLTLVEHAPSWPGLVAGYVFGFIAAFLPSDRPTGNVVSYGTFGAFILCLALTVAAVMTFLPMEFGSALLTMGGGILAGWGYQRAQ